MTTWTDDRVETLRRGWADGDSASKIAKEIGGDITRNAVIGKKNRLGLEQRRNSFGKSIKNVRAAERVAMMKRIEARSIAPEPKPEPVSVPVEQPQNLEHKIHCTLAENHHCRWPLWGDDTPFVEKFFCGVPGCDLVEGRPYCVSHSRVSVGPPMPRRPHNYFPNRAA